MAKQVFCYNGTHNSDAQLILHTVTAGRRAKVYLSYIFVNMSAGTFAGTYYLYAGNVAMVTHAISAGGGSATFPGIGALGANNAPVGENVLIGATSTSAYVSAVASVHLASGQTVRLLPPFMGSSSVTATYSICVVEEY